MKHCHRNVLLFLVCILYLLCTPSLVPAQYKAGQSLFLPEDRLIFPSPATFDGKQFVKVTCSGNTRPATRTTDRILALTRIPTAETFTLLKLADCFDSNGIYTQVQTQQHVIGYIQLPNLIPSSQQTASPPPSQNTILFYLIVIFLTVGIIWYAIHTPALAIGGRQGIGIIATTALTAVLAFYGYQVLGGAFIALTVIIAGIPWGLLFAGWHNPAHYRTREESFDFIRSILGIIPPLILLYILSRELSTQVSYSIIFAMSSLLFWFLEARHTNLINAEKAAEEDTERKRRLINGFVPYSVPLSRFLSQYHPDWYPPPIHDHLKTTIATYATFLRDLAHAKGETPNTAADDELIRSTFTERSFPDSWDYETTARCCDPLLGMLEILLVSSTLTLEENTQYATVLADLFAEKIHESELPPALRDKVPHIVEHLYARDNHGSTPAQEIEAIKARLTALIPAYIAQLRTVIGTAPDGLPVFYRDDERFQHSYIIGKTGSGKSTLLRNLITQDINHGYGVIVLSPENGLFQDLLAYIPEPRKNDLIYFDPTDIKPPIIGFNPLMLEQGEDLEAKAGETMTIFKRALGDLGVTMEPLIRNAVYALLQRPHSTITDIYHLIDPEDPTLRRTIAHTAIVDDLTRKFWIDYNKSPYYQKSFMPVVNRLSIFFRPPLSTILSTPALSFKEEMNKASRIIFLNLSRLRDLQHQSTGQLIIAQIQQALLSRDEIPERHRIPYYLYIDEFQTYAADSEGSLIKLFNGARKFRLAVTIAHQTTADIPSKLLSSIVGNVGTVACRQLAAEDAPFFARQLQIKRPNSEAAAPEILQNLTRADAYVATPTEHIGVHITIPKDPLVPLPAPIPKDELIATSKKNYGLIPETESAAVDSDTQHEHVAEPDTPAASEPLPQSAPPQKETPRRTPRRRRNRFDDDTGNPEIEVS